MFKKAFIGIILSAVFLTAFFIYKNYQLQNKKIVYHYSYFSQKEFYEEAYAQAGKIQPLPDLPLMRGGDKAIAGILVNHHLLAGHFIAEGFNKIATTSPVTIVLISPNHFAAGRSNIITSAAAWKTPYGELKPDLMLIKKISAANIAQIEEQPFEQEHGISGITAFIKKSLPNAKIVPIIIKDRLTLSEASVFSQNLSKLLPANSIIAGSFDFSHYLTARAADFHDEVNLAAVNNFDFELINRLDVDSRPGLLMFLKLMEIRGFKKFNLLEKNNSARVAGRQETLETTSYITGYFTAGEAEKNPVYSLLALGQIENASSTLNSLTRSSPDFSVKYLERLFYGQSVTAAFLETRNEKFENLLNRFNINRPIYNQDQIVLGSAKIVFGKNVFDAHKLIDGGAAVVIGDGQNISINEYRGKIIIGGLGRFITPESLKTDSQSLAVGLIYNEHQLQIYLLPIEFINREGKLLTGQKDAKVLAELAAKSGASSEIKEQIKKGIITLNIES